jgi:hypothetical protein
MPWQAMAMQHVSVAHCARESSSLLATLGRLCLNPAPWHFPMSIHPPPFHLPPPFPIPPSLHLLNYDRHTRYQVCAGRQRHHRQERAKRENRAEDTRGRTRSVCGVGGGGHVPAASAIVAAILQDGCHNSEVRLLLPVSHLLVSPPLYRVVLVVGHLGVCLLTPSALLLACYYHRPSVCHCPPHSAASGGHFHHPPTHPPTNPDFPPTYPPTNSPTHHATHPPTEDEPIVIPNACCVHRGSLPDWCRRVAAVIRACTLVPAAPRRIRKLTCHPKPA